MDIFGELFRHNQGIKFCDISSISNINTRTKEFSRPYAPAIRLFSIYPELPKSCHIMSKINGVMEQQDAMFVLESYSPEDVARAMVEGGRQQEAFYILDVDEVYRRIQHFNAMMPRVKIFYAMKSNDHEAILKLAVSQGLGFDCSSPGEIKRMRELSVDPSNIIYAMTSKTPSQMQYARASEVQYCTFDSSYELKKMQQYWPEAKLLLRIKVDSDSLYKLGEKFGCDFETEAVDLLEEAASLGLKVVGVAFHVGSACYSKGSYLTGLQQARALFDHEEKSGREMSILDIGGGFLSDRMDRINEVSGLVNATLAQLFPARVQVWAEPGRYLCDSAATFYTNITNIRRVMRAARLLHLIYINDGIFGTLRCSEPWHTVEKFLKKGEKECQEKQEVILYGPSCCPEDRVLGEGPLMLQKCTTSDWLVFKCNGAYSLTFTSRFSRLQLPLVRTVISLDMWNQVKRHPVFNSSTVVLNPDISGPLPSTLPPLDKGEDMHLPILGA